MDSEPTVFDVRAHIMSLIGDGRLGPEGRLPTERALCEATGAGRRMVRRALATLEAEGLIWRRQGKGTFAGQPAEPIEALAAEIDRTATPIEVMEARLCIEPELAALSALRARPEEVRRMWALARHQFEAGDDATIELWDSALHRLIAQSARNRALLSAFALLDDTRASAGWQGLRARARSALSLRETERQHRAIIEAIEAGQPEAARAAMRAHLATRYRAMSAEIAGGVTPTDDNAKEARHG
ncbi:MAG: FadR family transcriptional regulator [Rhizobium sp.]|nr:FadR family transcriptional regulator [Rhizobium sp.]